MNETAARDAPDADRPCDEVADGPDFEALGENARRLRIVNRKGLHARASAKFVQTVERFDAEVSVTRCGDTVGGRSIMGLLTLAAAKGTTIDVMARGAQAREALDALTALIAGRFGEEE
ncbi:MAG: HPr family phosphocarrier protein [Salinarimonadaceae bacterium]|nr:MAG: HPr family phosphocarrier protein [Salinarimonadaceae bacterium]